MTTTSERLRAVRRLHAERTQDRDPGDVAYLIYSGVLVSAIVVFPLVRSLVLLVARPEVVDHLSSASAPGAVSAIGAGVLAGACALGRIRGPISVRPFFVTILAGTDLPRRRTLRRTMVFSTVLVCLVLTVPAGLVAGVLVFDGAASASSVAVFLAGCIVFGVLASVLWLVGQRSSARLVWVIVIAVVAGGVGTWVIPSAMVAVPWGWLGLLWPTDHMVTGGALAALVVVTLASLGLVPRLLDSLSSNALLERAERWQRAHTAAATGDVAHAVGLFRSRPAIGRSWFGVRGRGAVTRFFISDTIAAVRTPGRLVIAGVGLAAGWVILVLSLGAPRTAVWMPAALGAVVVHTGLGVFSDGLRQSANTAANPVLFRHGPGAMFTARATVPLAAAALSALIGAGIGLSLGAPAVALVPVAVLIPALVLVRVYDSAKGELPIVLLTPVQSPVGDVSALAVLAWQADAVLAAGIMGGFTATLTAAGNIVPALVVVIAVAAYLLAVARHRVINLGWT